MKISRVEAIYQDIGSRENLATCWLRGGDERHSVGLVLGTSVLFACNFTSINATSGEIPEL